MVSYKNLSRITGWLVFAIAMVVYFFSAERTGSLWDCGEFILGAYKLQVVHPPGAPLFLIVGRMFTWVADIVSSNPSDIAFAVNLMSGMFTAFAAALVAWTTMILTRMMFAGREGNLSDDQNIVTCGAGLAAGLATAFSSSVWFSAVEGEVYAMSTFFTALTFWAIIEWYSRPRDDLKEDRWLIFAFYSAGLSIGVHLLSLLTFPAMALLIYLKKWKNPNVLGAIIAIGSGAALIPIIQKFIIAGIPALWSASELFAVNDLGMPFHSGLIFTLLIIAAIVFFGLRYAHKKDYGILQRVIVALSVIVIGFSTLGVVVIRANANPPINMNDPSDALRLLPYLNREQYGERPLFRGPHYEARPIDTKSVERYGQVGDHYEVVDQKISYIYDDDDKMLLPRIGFADGSRPALYREWMGDPKGKPSMAFNLNFLVRYQIGWMYIRYFMWNFVGRQNGEQGFKPWNKKSGHWLSGIKPLDSARLYNQSKLPETIKTNEARNKYFFLPLIFGLLGFFFHLKERRKDWLGVLIMFLFTGLGIIFYSNQPPNEPRERDYVLVGSFFTFCIWIGMAVPAIYSYLKDRISFDKRALGGIVAAIVLVAPVIMGFQNFDDHSRRFHYASRDYAINFLESCDENAIIFTYGDNDTYPLWYAQEVENIRTDVRVVNLSLIAVDWYINGLRRKINDSPAIKLSISEEAYRGNKRNQLFPPGQNRNVEMPVNRALKIMGETHPVSAGTQTFESYLPSTNLYIPINPQRALESGLVSPGEADKIVSKIPVKLSRNYITKDELAVLDVIMSNLYDRPIYFSVTCQESKLLKMNDYMQLEGLALKILPIKSNSDRNFYIYGSGRVNMDKAYENMVNKWRWGNFDKKEMFVDNSYGASVQAHKMTMLRTSLALLRTGAEERAVTLTDTYFNAFPHFNFPYDARVLPHINVYLQAGALDKVKKHLRILAVETADWMEFYDSLSQEDLNAGFRGEFNLAQSAIPQILSIAQQVDDEEFAGEMQALLEQYSSQQVRD